MSPAPHRTETFPASDDGQAIATARRKLRHTLRKDRNAISQIQQLRAASSVYSQLIHTTQFSAARRIAFYLPANGEIDSRPLLHHALRSGKHCYLPVLSPLKTGKMYFVRVRAGQSLRSNRWGILEPALNMRDIIRPWALDMVLVPLLGFDGKGNRLGMGKGYYDRAFAFRLKFNACTAAARHRPLLYGLAHPCQARPEIPAFEHDVRMDRVITAL